MVAPQVFLIGMILSFPETKKLLLSFAQRFLLVLPCLSGDVYGRDASKIVLLNWAERAMCVGF
ncbi:MAG: hypothetical protein AB2L21_04235 [Anaerolineaceae bacterium]